MLPQDVLVGKPYTYTLNDGQFLESYIAFSNNIDKKVSHRGTEGTENHRVLKSSVVLCALCASV